MAFVRSMVPPKDEGGKSFFLIFSPEGRILMQKPSDAGNRIPLVADGFWGDSELKNRCFLGYFNETACFGAVWAEEENGIPDIFEWVHLRALVRDIDYEIWEMIGYARQINDCHENFRYCGKCGKKTVRKTDEQARFCAACNLTFYPKISPAIITAVIREDRILLARGVNFPNKKMFSVLAGFVDAQERLEDCVVREVFEETGINVKHVTYFDSQPWPFPDSLMIGFTAEYESGEIRIDPAEIEEAAWFKADELPLVPGKPTLSAALIQWFVRRSKEKQNSIK